jgi:hypothetical protein
LFDDRQMLRVRHLLRRFRGLASAASHVRLRLCVARGLSPSRRSWRRRGW